MEKTLPLFLPCLAFFKIGFVESCALCFVVLVVSPGSLNFYGFFLHILEEFSYSVHPVQTLHFEDYLQQGLHSSGSQKCMEAFVDGVDVFVGFPHDRFSIGYFYILFVGSLDCERFEID